MAAKKKSPRRKLFPLGTILNRSFKNLGIDFKIAQQKVIDNWSKIVGEQIDSISKPDHFKFRTLFVNVADPIWLHQLVFLEDKVKDNINQKSGKKLVQKIYFKVGDLRVKEVKKSVKNEDLNFDFRNHTDLTDEKEVDGVIDTLNDPELKTILKRIMLKGKGAGKFRRLQKVHTCTN